MAHKMKASQFTYASRAITSPRKPLSVSMQARAAFRHRDRATAIAVRAGTDGAMPMTDHSACQPPAASSLRLTRAKKGDAMAEALIKVLISGRAVARP
ncbi:MULTISPECIES: hypothetical protein [Bradyrhizobium]|uniref:hypothetical protein n=1 Tax=Bradyrhizobium TaxID=374 RepID=UPI000FE3CEF2|nr:MULTISPECIES: hypothetical protein [Bradyrhizobium]TGN73513.1 hypothetical protein EOW77_0034635 [Bradyrhizobium yuanmingense]UWU68079.1 hypothetical protein N2602_33970 [Bradyrhizobium sp. NC92]